MADRLVVFGSGGHAKVIVEAALTAWPGREIVVLDDDNSRPAILGFHIAGGRALLDTLRGSDVIAAVGDNHARAELLEWLQEHDHQLATVIHPRAMVSASAKIEPGSFVSAGAIIVADARVSAGAIVNTGASVDHDCILEECAHVAPGAHLCGNVRIGARSLVGVGAALRPGISVAADVVIGAGAVVVKNIATAGTFAGNPARRLD